MLIKEVDIRGIFVIEPQLFEDSRGHFFESFNLKKFEDAIGEKANFVQDNQSRSNYGVIRGLHFQTPPFEQAKLVRVLSGEVLDIAVDLRKGSNTFGKHFSILLSDKNQKQVFIPKGFAHGFVVLSQFADFFYKCDNYYAPDHYSGIKYNDPDLNIDWKIHNLDIKLSQKDESLPSFQSLLQH